MYHGDPESFPSGDHCYGGKLLSPHITPLPPPTPPSRRVLYTRLSSRANLRQQAYLHGPDILFSLFQAYPGSPGSAVAMVL